MAGLQIKLANHRVLVLALVLAHVRLVNLLMVKQIVPIAWKDNTKTKMALFIVKIAQSDIPKIFQVKLHATNAQVDFIKMKTVNKLANRGQRRVYAKVKQHPTTQKIEPLCLILMVVGTQDVL